MAPRRPGPGPALGGSVLLANAGRMARTGGLLIMQGCLLLMLAGIVTACDISNQGTPGSEMDGQAAAPSADHSPMPAATVSVTNEPTSTTVPAATVPAATPPATETPPLPNPTLTPRQKAANDLAEAAPWIADPGGSGLESAAELLVETWHLDAALANDMARIPWVTDGIRLNQLDTLAQVRDVALADRAVFDELTAYWLNHGFSHGLLRLLHAISADDPQLARQVALFPWVGDGLSSHEEEVLRRITAQDPVDMELAKGILSQPWVADGVMENEADGAINLIESWESNPQLGKFLALQYWVMDGLTELERSSMNRLKGIAESGPESMLIAISLAGSLWYPDGLDGDDPFQGEISASKALDKISKSDAGLTKAVSTLGWLFDDLTTAEAVSIEGIAQVAENAPDLAAWATAAPWVRDGITGIEASALSGLNHLSRVNLPVARLVAGFTPQVPPRYRDVFLVLSLYRLHQDERERFDQLISEPWFRDGLDPQERAYITALRAAVDAWYDDLYESYHTRSATIESPLSG